MLPSPPVRQGKVLSEGEHGESAVSVGSVTPKAMSKETKQSHVTSQCSERRRYR